MLALDLVKQGSRLLGIAAVQPVLGGGIKRVDIARDVGNILLGLGPGAPGSGAERHGDRGKKSDAERAASPA
jgi:hypothetical protein